MQTTRSPAASKPVRGTAFAHTCSHVHGTFSRARSLTVAALYSTRGKLLCAQLLLLMTGLLHRLQWYVMFFILLMSISASIGSGGL
jgi:hypothetical protein